MNGYVPTYVRSKMLSSLMEMESDFSIKELLSRMSNERTPISKNAAYSNIKIFSLFGLVEIVAIKDPVDGLVWRYRTRELQLENV